MAGKGGKCRKFLNKCCGPKYYVCYMILSVWGCLQLVVMGICFWFQAVALLEDAHPHEDFNGTAEFYKHVEELYHGKAVNCWIAAAVYVATFLLSGFFFFKSTRSRVKAVQKKPEGQKSGQVRQASLDIPETKKTLHQTYKGT